MQNNAQQGSVDFNVAVVFDEPQLAKLVHKEIDPRAGGADHFRQHFLGNIGEYTVGLVLFTIEVGGSQKGDDRQRLPATLLFCMFGTRVGRGISQRGRVGG